ncbi:hypothetical protein NE236_00985 [Actinoallomurus purpureus]|uniref:hypothetical protein n=1 Tax=Actinoallomurus purpureus TaxID=478114 RepID=UPI002091FB3C|nr:hypothetical protein [Actinoallomurus purpureus]MCO6003552.1 hypothetical protein [Actinoallomurus purpureus]
MQMHTGLEPEILILEWERKQRFAEIGSIWIVVTPRFGVDIWQLTEVGHRTRDIRVDVDTERIQPYRDHEKIRHRISKDSPPLVQK